MGRAPWRRRSLLPWSKEHRQTLWRRWQMRMRMRTRRRARIVAATRCVRCTSTAASTMWSNALAMRSRCPPAKAVVRGEVRASRSVQGMDPKQRRRQVTLRPQRLWPLTLLLPQWHCRCQVRGTMRRRALAAEHRPSCDSRWRLMLLRRRVPERVQPPYCYGRWWLLLLRRRVPERFHRQQFLCTYENERAG